MDSIDAEVGFWVKDLPYVFKNGENVENSERKYLQVFPEFDKIKRKECNWVSRYFGTHTILYKTIKAVVHSNVPDSFVNGRQCYYTPDLEIPSGFDVSVPTLGETTELCKSLIPYNGIEFDLSSLICTQMSLGSSSLLRWESVFELMKNCPPISKCDPCTKIGTKVAKSLIKIAALRIFADPEQSIMELPVNSIDAYASLSGTGKIGKFGMGFFSILYWLVGHPKRSIVIHSFSGENGKYETYQVVIREIQGSLSFALTVYPESKITTTGFRVYLDASQDKFHPDVVLRFKEQISKLDYSFGATIYQSAGGSYNDFRKSKIVNPGTKRNIFCSVTENYLLNEDFATGVPLQILLGSLFVPSISTKTIQLSSGSHRSPTGSINNSRLIRNTGGRNLLFLIGGIAVISIKGEGCAPDTYIIDLPSTTRLPVSRDDFILDEDGETEKILLESISMVFDAAKTIKDVSCFQLLLENYLEFTPSSANKMVVKRALTDFFFKNKGVLVPIEHQQLYKTIDPSFVVSRVYDASSIEEWLDRNKNPIRNIWHGAKVLFVSSDIQTSGGGLVSYLFIGENYKNKLGSNWIATVTSCVIGRKLYPFGSSYGTREYEKYENLVKNKPASKMITKETTKLFYFAVLNKLESLEDRFQIKSNVLPDLAEHLLDISLYVPEDSFLMFLTELMTKFSSFKGNQTYGGGKYTLNYWYGPSSYGQYMNPHSAFNFPKSDKIIPYTIEHIVYSIRAIQEGNDTNVVLITRNCPWETIRMTSQNPSELFFAQKVFENSANFIEFQFMIAGAGRAYKELKTGVSEQITKDVVSHFLEKTRARNLGARDIVHLYDLWKNEAGHYARSTLIYLVKEGNEASEWLKISAGISNIPAGRDIIDLSPEKQIKLSTMVRTLFKTDLPGDEKDEEEFYSKISSSKDSKGDLQIIEIAVNEGTVKPFIEATMTELIQNSIDAVREFNPKDVGIDMHLSKTDGHIILNFTDRVGMSKEAFVYIGIPFLSTKTPSELVTGEMGSGFFNAYRECDRLKIDTIKNGISRVSIDTPVRDNRGRVVDITKTIEVGKAPAGFDNQTHISISIPIRNDSHFANLTSRAIYTAQNIIGLALADNIKFNGKSVHIKRELVARIGYLELYITDSQTSKHESFLLTKGVPFAPLQGYIKHFVTPRTLEAVDRNVILNITHGGYTPVQTRTRINLAPEVEKDFKEMAIYSVFVIMLREIYTGHRLYALDHINSVSDPRQLLFTIYDIENTMSYADETYFLKFTKFYGMPSIAELINGCISLGKDKMMDLGSRTEYLRSKCKSPYPNINEMVIYVVNKWFEPKKISATPGRAKPSQSKPPQKYRSLTIPELKEILRTRKLKVSGKKEELVDRLIEDDKIETESDEEDTPDPEMTNIIGTWIKVFWEISKDAKITGYHGRAPSCTASCSEKNQSYLGYFSPGTKSIVINTFTWTKQDRNQILSVMKKKNAEDFVSGVLKNNKAWEKFFSYSVPSSTIVHELEHARRNTSHESSGHDSKYESLFPGNVPKIRTFNESANAVFEKVLASGFYEKFLKALKI